MCLGAKERAVPLTCWEGQSEGQPVSRLQGVCGLRTHPTSRSQEHRGWGKDWATVCKGACLTYPLALTRAPGTGPSVSLPEVPEPPRPGQLNSGDSMLWAQSIL